MKQCHRCGTPWISEKRQPGVKELCLKCSAYLHSCLNCRFHRPKAHNECYIPDTEWVADRAGANFCDQFEFADAQVQNAEDTKKANARDAVDRLLGGTESPDRPKSLNDLFGGE